MYFLLWNRTIAYADSYTYPILMITHNTCWWFWPPSLGFRIQNAIQKSSLKYLGYCVLENMYYLRQLTDKTVILLNSTKKHTYTQYKYIFFFFSCKSLKRLRYTIYVILQFFLKDLWYLRHNSFLTIGTHNYITYYYSFFAIFDFT